MVFLPFPILVAVIHFFLAAPEAVGSDWFPVIVSFITAIVTVGTSFWVSRGKQKTTDFEAIIDERKEFTEEIRKELKRRHEEHERELEEERERYKNLKLLIAEKDAEILALRTELTIIRKNAP